MSTSYRVAVLQVSKEIKEDRISLEAQEKYYQNLLDNIGREDGMIGRIDMQILKLQREREKIIQHFEIAPQRLKEIRQWLKQLGVKKEKLLITPKINRFMELREKLIKMGEGV